MSRQPLKITLIRHGQSVSNTAKRFGGHSDIPLSPIGKLQAELTAEALAHEGVTRVLASDLSRARDTAAAIAARTGVTLEIYRELRERDVGTLTGLTFEEAQATQAAAYSDLFSGDPNRKIGGAESYADVVRRVDGFLHKIYRETEGHLVVVSHMMVLTHLLRKACGVDERSLRGALTFSIENAALHRLSLGRGARPHWHVFAINQTDHLKSLQADDSLGQPE